MKTRIGEAISTTSPLSEYPTPQFRRRSYLSLNGPWDFSIVRSGEKPDYRRRILVPFSVETPLSGIEEKVGKDDVMCYRRYFVLPDGFSHGRVLLHFEAVDQVCDVFLNDVRIAHHEGGYLPFTIDCMELRRGENELRVEVRDDTDSPIYPRGKQSSKPGGIWYHPTSGIYGSVWLESVPNQVIQRLAITPLFDQKKLSMHVFFEGKIVTSSIIVSFKGKEIARGELDSKGDVVLDLAGTFHPWSPDNPQLYDLEVKVNSDAVKSYFAMRKVSTIEFEGHKVFALNNKPLFLSGVLDQGYYPDGGLTCPSDEIMVRELKAIQDLGFNMIRKHIKIEPMRWYYHCDTLGILVIQDLVNGGAPYKKSLIMLAPFLHIHVDDEKSFQQLGRGDEASRAFFEDSMEPTVARLYNSPCVVAYTLFNEGWGQFESRRLSIKLRELDPTRLIDATSGWFDTGSGDFDSHHVYFRKAKLKNDGKRILSLSEFGGYSLKVERHTYSEKSFGYKAYRDKTKLNAGFRRLYEEQVIPMKENEGLSAAVLTQWSDVEEEINGLITYDRAEVKADRELFRYINQRLKFK